MSKTFAVIRPYPDDIRRLVFQRLNQLGFELGEGLIVDPQTSDEESAAWAMDNRAKFDLLLVPFHLHKGKEGEPLTGFGVLNLLPKEWNTPLLMPVTSYSYHASFERHLVKLMEERPSLVSLLKPTPLSSLYDGAAELRVWLKSAYNPHA